MSISIGVYLVVKDLCVLVISIGLAFEFMFWEFWCFDVMKGYWCFEECCVPV